MILEICIDNIRSATAAKAGGADRLEICGPLSVGGTTPSAGLIEQCVALGDVGIVVMIRPHEGGFCYDEADVQTMLGDIRFAKQLGADGVVIGALTADRHVDVDVCRRLIDEARPMALTFHRAFDVIADPDAAIESLLRLQVDRLLTSGLAPTAIEGCDAIQRLVEQSAGSLQVIAASGVNVHNAGEIITKTNVAEIHASAANLCSPTDYAIDFGGAARTTCESRVRSLKTRLNRMSMSAD